MNLTNEDVRKIFEKNTKCHGGGQMCGLENYMLG